MKTRTVLVTGFEPFGGDALNPSMELLPRLHGVLLSGARVQTQLLPCVFGRSLQVLQEAVARVQPELVVALGLAANRAAISVERVAINVDDARIADNAGQQPVDRSIVPGGPVAYFSTLPMKAIVAALREAGIAAEVSQTAGTFVCNHVFYGLMHGLASSRQPVRAGFIHVPPLPGQRPEGGGMPLDEMERGLRLAIEVALITTADRREPGGAIA
jgi:pyroglutamyl-peptidase